MTAWWVPNVAFALVGLALVALGVYDHDNQALTSVGIGLVSLSTGHALGLRQPPP